jgi:glucose-1-phosphatase
LIELIVSDLGKVLLPFDSERPWLALNRACPECPSLRPDFQRLFMEAGMGRGTTDPEHFYRTLVEATGIRITYRELCTLWSDMFTVDVETIRLIVSAPVRERHILSNTNAIHWEFIRDRYCDVLRSFDRHWVSHELGLEKPDLAIYERVIAETGVSPERHLFIDDIEENVVAARQSGMHGIVHTDAVALAESFRDLGLSA